MYGVWIYEVHSASDPTPGTVPDASPKFWLTPAHLDIKAWIWHEIYVCIYTSIPAVIHAKPPRATHKSWMRTKSPLKSAEKRTDLHSANIVSGDSSWVYLTLTNIGENVRNYPRKPKSMGVDDRVSNTTWPDSVSHLNLTGRRSRNSFTSHERHSCKESGTSNGGQCPDTIRDEGKAYPIDQLLPQGLDLNDVDLTSFQTCLGHQHQYKPGKAPRGPNPAETSKREKSSNRILAPAPLTFCDGCYAYAEQQLIGGQDQATPPANTPTQPPVEKQGEPLGSGPIPRAWTTPLQIAIARGHVSAVRILLQEGADPNAVDSEGSSALHTAVRSGHNTIVRELLRFRASPAIVDSIGWSPLHYAAETGDEHCLRALLQAGKDLCPGDPMSKVR